MSLVLHSKNNMKKFLVVILVLINVYVIYTGYKIFFWEPKVVSEAPQDFCLTTPTSPFIGTNIFTGECHYWPGSSCLISKNIPWWYKGSCSQEGLESVSKEIGISIESLQRLNLQPGRF